MQENEEANTIITLNIKKPKKDTAAECIKFYWYIKSDEIVNDNIVTWSFMNEHICLFIKDSNNCTIDILNQNNHVSLNKCSILFPTDFSKRISMSGDIKLFGIAIKEGYSFSKIKNYIIGAKNSIQSSIIQADEICSELNTDYYINNIFRDNKKIANFVTEIAHNNNIYCDKRVCAAIDLIQKGHNSYDDATLSYLSKQIDISTRQLQRIFRSNIGITPTKYAQMLRRKNAYHEIIMNDDKPLTNIAMDNRYYDHAHFTKDIIHFMGKRPNEIRREVAEILEKGNYINIEGEFTPDMILPYDIIPQTLTKE